MIFPLRFHPTATPATAVCALMEIAGTPLVLEGHVHDDAGRGLRGATVLVRHSDGSGTVRCGTRLAAACASDDEGRFAVTTVQPAPYQIRTDGPAGWFVAHEGWHPWRPGHLHVTVKAPDMRTVTARLYFRRDDWIRHDAPAWAILDPCPGADDVDRAVHDFTLAPAGQRTSTYSAYPTPSIASPPNVPV
ncbi:carboxypeptidase regulatory-like domain-containing protein [Rhodococcus sp. ACT016]|uniref:dioxygenase family protein n=1 Tax=Rhodococcus sp. ACT016 TaxID=3134808 RepID=UPI003D29D454